MDQSSRIRPTALSAVLVGVALVLQACGTTSSPGASSAASGGGSGEVIKIGGIWPITGSLALLGTYQEHGAQLAVDEINAKGGVKSMGGAKLELMIGDTQGKPDVGQQEANRLMDSGAVALIGALQSAVTFVTTQEAAKRGIPHLVDEGISDSVTSRGLNNIFRITGSTASVAKYETEVLQTLKKADGSPVKTLVIMNEDSLFGTSVGDIFEKTLQGTGLQVVDRISYKASAPDLSTEVAKAKADNADILVHIGYLTDGTLIAKTARQQQVQSVLFGLVSGAFSHPNFVKDLGPLANGVLDVNWGVSPNATNSAAVAKAYQAKYPNDPWNHHALNSYTAVLVLADALERAGTSDPAKLIAALHATDLANHPLAQKGPLKFDDKGENINAQPLLFQIQDQKIEIVKPDEFATAKLVFPPPQP